MGNRHNFHNWCYDIHTDRSYFSNCTMIHNLILHTRYTLFHTRYILYPFRIRSYLFRNQDIHHCRRYNHRVHTHCHNRHSLMCFHIHCCIHRIHCIHRNHHNHCCIQDFHNSHIWYLKKKKKIDEIEIFISIQKK